MDIILDVLIDTAKMIPLIVLTYILLDIYERNTNINEKINLLLSKNWGPIFGALIGCIPQCGFSFMAATLFVHKMITPGTLVAVFIATSDEALPLLIANPSEYKALLFLIVCKLIIATIGGYLLDLGITLFTKKKADSVNSAIDEDEEVEIEINDPTCVCGNSMLYNVVVRSLKVLGFILFVNATLSGIIYFIGEDTLISFLNSTILIQPILAALVGFIPNCAASIILCELYLLNGISFGALISGLCTGAGIGMVVLFKDLKDKKQLALIISYLFILSVVVGEIIYFIDLI